MRWTSCVRVSLSHSNFKSWLRHGCLCLALCIMRSCRFIVCIPLSMMIVTLKYNLIREWNSWKNSTCSIKRSEQETYGEISIKMQKELMECIRCRWFLYLNTIKISTLHLIRNVLEFTFYYLQRNSGKNFIISNNKQN